MEQASNRASLLARESIGLAECADAPRNDDAAMSTIREFEKLLGIQLTELGVRIEGPLPSDIPTQLALSFGIKRGKRKDEEGTVLVVMLELKAAAGQIDDVSETPILSALCRLTGAWVAHDPKAEPSTLELDARKHAIPILYPLARQHLSDVLGKAGANNAKWPWNIEALEVSSVSGSETLAKNYSKPKGSRPRSRPAGPRARK
jgi:hypothetical protein